MSRITIKETDLQTAYEVSLGIPEFHGPPPLKEYKRRLDGVPHLILVAFENDKAVGFKVGYERDGGFYSWMGGVLPSYRRRNVATRLAQYQEKWAQEHGYDCVTFKTRNQHLNMLLFSLRRGFIVVGFKEKDDPTANRIILRKVL